MVKRTCPECGANWYSVNAQAEFWICDECGTKISIELQEVAQ